MWLYKQLQCYKKTFSPTAIFNCTSKLREIREKERLDKPITIQGERNLLFEQVTDLINMELDSNSKIKLRFGSEESRPYRRIKPKKPNMLYQAMENILPVFLVDSFKSKLNFD